MISTSIFIGLVLLFVICIARTIAGQIDDLKHQYETRIVQLEDGRYQVEEFNYDSADWYGENWHGLVAYKCEFIRCWRRSEYA